MDEVIVFPIPLSIKIFNIVESIITTKYKNVNFATYVKNDIQLRYVDNIKLKL